MTTQVWNVTIELVEEPGGLRACARLSAGGREVRGLGHVRGQGVLGDAEHRWSAAARRALEDLQLAMQDTFETGHLLHADQA